MPSILLNAPTTFKHKVTIPGPGDASLTGEFVFKWLRKSELDALMNEPSPDRTDLDLMMSIVDGWTDFEPEFSRDAMGSLLQNWHNAGNTLATEFVNELTGHRPDRKETAK